MRGWGPCPAIATRSRCWTCKVLPGQGHTMVSRSHHPRHREQKAGQGCKQVVVAYSKCKYLAWPCASRQSCWGPRHSRTLPASRMLPPYFRQTTAALAALSLPQPLPTTPAAHPVPCVHLRCHCRPLLYAAGWSSWMSQRSMWARCWRDTGRRCRGRRQQGWRGVARRLLLPAVASRLSSCGGGCRICLTPTGGCMEWRWARWR